MINNDLLLFHAGTNAKDDLNRTKSSGRGVLQWKTLGSRLCSVWSLVGKAQVGRDASCTSISVWYCRLCFGFYDHVILLGLRNKNYWIVLGSFWQSGVRTPSKKSLLTSWGRFWSRYLRRWRLRVEANLRTADRGILTVPLRESWLEPHFKYQCTKHTAREVKRK